MCRIFKSVETLHYPYHFSLAIVFLTGPVTYYVALSVKRNIFYQLKRK